MKTILQFLLVIFSPLVLGGALLIMAFDYMDTTLFSSNGFKVLVGLIYTCIWITCFETLGD